MTDLIKCAIPLLLCVFLVSGCARSPDAESARSFVEAQEAFEQAEKLPSTEQPEAFRRVAARYRSLVDRGVKSGAVYYNMGNAWMRADEPAQALAAYLTAQRYSPLDPHVASNIQTVLGAATQAESATPVIEHLFFWQDWLGVRQKASISVTLASAALLCGVATLFVRHRRLRRTALTLAVLAFVAIVSTGYDWYRFEYVRHAIVATDQVMPRKGNSEQYELSFTTPIPFGTDAVVLDERGDWLRLRFGADRDGWLPKSQVVEY